MRGNCLCWIKAGDKKETVVEIVKNCVNKDCFFLPDESTQRRIRQLRMTLVFRLDDEADAQSRTRRIVQSDD